jgi:hypothetical protein
MYSEYKDKPWVFDSRFKTYAEVFLIDVLDLEKNGVTRPEFENIKELLKK